MGLLRSGFPADSTFQEGRVTSLDPDKYLCDVLLFSGQSLRDVGCLSQTGGSDSGGFQALPHIGDRVLITAALGYPLILGTLPQAGNPGFSAYNIFDGSPPINQGTASPLFNGAQSNMGKPADYLPGDMLFTNATGGLVGLLREGTAVIRASNLAQILVSRWDDLVRIVGRNYERISDFSSEIVANLTGRPYRFYGFNRNAGLAQQRIYEYREIHGDVAAAEYGTDNPFNAVAPLPAANSYILKRHLISNNGNGTDLLVETTDNQGQINLIITNSAGVPSGVSTQTSESTSLLYQVVIGSTTVSLNINGTNAVLNYNNQALCTLNANSAVLDYSGQALCTLNNSEASLTFGSSASCTLTGSQSEIAFGGSTGTFNSSSAVIASNGHSVNVTASGVALV